MNAKFLDALGQMFSAAPQNVRDGLRVKSGYRSPQRQRELWKDALKKYGSVKEARKWVAPPGRSFHNRGFAADLQFLNAEARKWVHENAKKFGLNFPLRNENWHIELTGVRGGKGLGLANLVNRSPALPDAVPVPASRPPVGVDPFPKAPVVRQRQDVNAPTYSAPRGNVERMALPPVSQKTVSPQKQAAAYQQYGKSRAAAPPRKDTVGGAIMDPNRTFGPRHPNSVPYEGPGATMDPGKKDVWWTGYEPKSPQQIRESLAPKPAASPTISKMLSGMDAPVKGPSGLNTPTNTKLKNAYTQMGATKAAAPTVDPKIANAYAVYGATRAAAPATPVAPPAPVAAPKPQPRPLTRTVMPAVVAPPPVPQPAPRPQQALGRVGYGAKAIDNILGGGGQPGEIAISRSNPDVSYRALSNGMVEKRNAKYGTVSYSYGGPNTTVRTALGQRNTVMQRDGSNALGGRGGSGGGGRTSGGGGNYSGVSGGTRTSGGGYGQGGQHARGSDFTKHDR